MTSNYKFNLKPDAIDWNDLVYIPVGGVLRENVDLRKWASPVEDQRQLGSCTSNAMIGAYEMDTLIAKPAEFVNLSRLFIYYNTRKLDGTIEEDSGASVKDTLRAVTIGGICTENLWPYDINYYTVEPTPESYIDAKKRKIKEYFKVTSIDSMLDALNQNRPIIFGMLVYEPFMELSATNTILRASSHPKWSAIGAHAMVMVGYSLTERLFLVRNSFGPNWGINGYCWISFDYISAEAWDAWVYNIELVDISVDKYYNESSRDIK